MAMDTMFAQLACFLLAFSFVAPQSEKNPTTPPTVTTPGLNLTHTTAVVTISNSTERTTVISNFTENTTPFTSTSQHNDTYTNTTATTPTTEITGHVQTSQPTTTMTPLTNTTSLINTTTGTHTASSTALTTPAALTTVGYMTTPDAPVVTTANSSHTVNTTPDLTHRTTQGLGLNISDKAMIIVLSVILGTFATALAVFMLHRCKQKIQYLHQPLNNTEDTADAFVADEDTLVISGGLYDGHPIYDNVPTVTADQSQFRLEFLH